MSLPILIPSLCPYTFDQNPAGHQGKTKTLHLTRPQTESDIKECVKIPNYQESPNHTLQHIAPWEMEGLNGLITLGNMLSSLPLTEKHKRPLHKQTLTYANISTVHEATGFAPFQLIFGHTGWHKVEWFEP